MPYYPPQPRQTGRERKFAQLQQMQQSDIQQQQADAQQQAAMLAQITQLYGLQQQQQMDPVRMEAARLANEQLQYGLQSAQQLDPVRLQAALLANRQGEYALQHSQQHDAQFDPLNAQALQGGIEAQKFQTERGRALMPGELQQQGDIHARSQYIQDRAAQFDPYELAALQASIEGQQAGTDATRFNTQHARDMSLGDLTQQDLQNTGLRQRNTAADLQNQWAPLYAQQMFDQNKAQTDQARAHTMMTLNPFNPPNAQTQAQLYQGVDFGQSIPHDLEQARAQRELLLRNMGYDAQGNPLPVDQTETSTSESSIFGPMPQIPRNPLSDAKTQFKDYVKKVKKQPQLFSFPLTPFSK